MEDPSARSIALALACALASVAGTLLVLPAITAIGRAHWKGNPLARVALRGGLAGGIPALLVALGFIRAVSVAETTAIVIAAAIGCCAHIGTMAARYAPMRRLHRMLPRLTAPATRADAVLRIEALIDQSRPAALSGPWLATWTTTVLNAAEHLANANEFEAAARVLGRLGGLQLTGVLAALRDALSALTKIFRGQHEAAQGALSAITRPSALPMVEAMVLSLDSLLRALDGRHDDALRMLRSWPYPEAWHLRSRLVARAHALTASGDDAAARNTLHEIERRYGAAGLAAAAGVDGPASELARSISGGVAA